MTAGHGRLSSNDRRLGSELALTGLEGEMKGPPGPQVL